MHTLIIFLTLPSLSFLFLPPIFMKPLLFSLKLISYLLNVLLNFHGSLHLSRLFMWAAYMGMGGGYLFEKDTLPVTMPLKYVSLFLSRLHVFQKQLRTWPHIVLDRELGR